MNPVATFSRWKPLLLGSFSAVFGLLTLGIALILVPWFVHTEVVGRQHGSWGLLALGILPLVIGWASTSSGILRLRAVFEKNLRLLAGPEGISLRVPGRAKASRLWFSYDLIELAVPWTDVLDVYTFTTKVNGTPMFRRLVIATRRGTVTIEGVLLRESPMQIEAALDKVRAAASAR